MKLLSWIVAAVILIIFGRHIITHQSIYYMTTLEWVVAGVLIAFELVMLVLDKRKERIE